MMSSKLALLIIEKAEPGSIRSQRHRQSWLLEWRLSLLRNVSEKERKKKHPGFVCFSSSLCKIKTKMFQEEKNPLSQLLLCGDKIEIKGDKESTRECLGGECVRPSVYVCACYLLCMLFPKYSGSWGSIFQTVCTACQPREIHLYAWYKR